MSFIWGKQVFLYITVSFEFDEVETNEETVPELPENPVDESGNQPNEGV